MVGIKRIEVKVDPREQTAHWVAVALGFGVLVNLLGRSLVSACFPDVFALAHRGLCASPGRMGSVLQIFRGTLDIADSIVVTFGALAAYSAPAGWRHCLEERRHV